MKRHRLFAAALLACGVFLSALPFTASAAASLSVSKKTFFEGEPIYVTAVSASSKDWVGVVPAVGGRPVVSAGSIVWKYIRTSDGSGASQGAGDGKTFDIRTGTVKGTDALSRIASAAGVSAERLGTLPAGSYAVCLVEKDADVKNGYLLCEFFDVVKPDVYDPSAAPVTPAEVAYERRDPSSFFAEGKITVTPGEGTSPSNTTGYEIFFKNGNGLLKGYGPVALVNADGMNAVSFEIGGSVILPPDADGVACRALNRFTGQYSVFATTDIVISDRYDAPASPRAVYGIISDVHVNGSALHANHIASAFNYMRKAGVSAVFAVGDIADHGSESEYAQFFSAASKEGFGAEKIFLALGNHDTRDGGSSYGSDYGAVVKKFLRYISVPDGFEKPTDRLYYDFRLDGTHFVFLASERPGTHAYLSDAQLAWLDEVLAKDGTGERTFVFLHQSLYDTVAGSLRVGGVDQAWNGIIAGDAALGALGYNRPTVSSYRRAESELRKIFEKHPSLIMFSGHSHWEMRSESNFRPSDGKLPNLANTAATGYLWTSRNVVTGESLEGAEGYIVSVYDDRIVLTGTDFVTGEIIPAACYYVPLVAERLGSGEETAPEGTEETGNGGSGDTGTLPSSEDTSAGPSGEPAVTGDATGAGEKRGCRSSLASALPGILTPAPLCALIRRKKARR